MAGGAGNNRMRDNGPPQGQYQQYRQPGQAGFDNGSPTQQCQTPQQQHPGLPQQVAPRPHSGGYDGPSEPSGAPRQNPFGQGLSYDPAKPATKVKIITNTR